MNISRNQDGSFSITGTGDEGRLITAAVMVANGEDVNVYTTLASTMGESDRGLVKASDELAAAFGLERIEE